MSEMKLRAEHLVKKYKKRSVVNNVSVEVSQGEIVGLLGPNGAGKTTTIGMLTTRVIPTNGEMWIAGINVRARQQEVKRIIGVVTQFNTLDRRLTAWENLYHHGRYFGLSRNDSRREATRVLELVRLEERGKSLVDELSGGMQQRLLIGRALVHRPEVLFLDEPTTGIDPQGRLALWDILLQLHHEGQTILLTTHYMEEAEHLCQRVAIMDHGKILAMGSPNELKGSIGAETIITLQAEPVTPSFIGALEGISGVRSVDEGPRGLQVLAGDSRRLIPHIAETALAQEVDLSDISVSTPTLETVFMRLTGRELRD